MWAHLKQKYSTSGPPWAVDREFVDIVLRLKHAHGEREGKMFNFDGFHNVFGGPGNSLPDMQSQNPSFSLRFSTI